MADEKKLTEDQLDEVAGGIGGDAAIVGSVAFGGQAIVDQSQNIKFSETLVQDNSTNVSVDDVTQVNAGIFDNSWNQYQENKNGSSGSMQ